MIKSPLAKIFTVKVLGLAAACGTAGGVALAANAGAFSTDAHASPSSHVPAAVAVGAPAQARPGAAGTGQTAGTLADGTASTAAPPAPAGPPGCAGRWPARPSDWRARPSAATR